MGTFNGSSVFLSRNLVPPEMFDALHDALRLNGAQVFLCCDPSRNAANDYHVIASQDHEKFEDLRAKGCNLLGPHCVLSCAKERRVLPEQPYTCCLAMDGVRVLASGFDKDEKVKIEQLTTAMAGTLVNRAALDVSFVIAKNVMAAKYKWAMYILKKPVVSLNWLHQCWTEHRVVPHEPYRILPFSGLTICVTGIPADERDEMKALILQNGGKYSADLTKKCTHLISDVPEGDKYLVARKWGHILLVNRKWFKQSIARKACLDEGHYTVSQVSAPSSNLKSIMKSQSTQDQSIRMSESAATSACFSDFDISTSQIASSNFSDNDNIKTDDGDLVVNKTGDVLINPCNAAKDSEDEDNDLYLSDCRILLLGFDEKEQRRLVKMIWNGGGTRHMLLSEKLTHIIVGSPSEAEKKEVRRLAAYGIINIVKTVWLEDCDAMKKEIPFSQRHSACDLLLPKDAAFSYKISSAVVPKMNKERNSSAFAGVAASQVHFDKSADETYQTEAVKVAVKDNVSFSRAKSRKIGDIDNGRLRSNANASGSQCGAENIFKGMRFCFSTLFPVDKREEIKEWISQGGGFLVTNTKLAQYIIECHGSNGLSHHHHHTSLSRPTMVSSHWIRFCLQEMCILDVGSHVLFSPLTCKIPLTGFDGFRFCVSQYEEKERLLLKNLCFILGAKFTEKLTKKVTHLICKFTSGPKYEAACTWGIQSVTADWINECVKQDMIVPMDGFRPIAAQDSDAGLCITSQYPTQAVRMISTEVPSQPLKNRFDISSKDCEESEPFRSLDKRPKFSEVNFDCEKSTVNAVADVAGVIEDLLAQSNKGTKTTADEESCPQSVSFSLNHKFDSLTFQTLTFDSRSQVYSPGNFTSYQMSDRGLRRFDDEVHEHEKTSEVNPDAFSETQTESQVVWYEEDLSGRQKIIERVRSQSMGLTPEPK